MHSKTILLVALSALTSFAAASPPACLIGAVNTYSDPADIAAVCKAKDATSKIAKMCGDDAEAALSAFADTCNGAGVKVSTDIPTSATVSGSHSTATLKPSGTGATTLATATTTGTGAYTTGGAASPTGGSSAPGGGSPAQSGSPSGTGPGAAESTGAAGKIEMSAAALLGVFGVVAAVL